MTSSQRTWAIVLGITLMSATTAWYSARAPLPAASSVPARALKMVVVEHDDQRVEVRPGQSARALMTLTRQGTSETYLVDPHKATRLWSTLEHAPLPFVPLESPGPLKLYGLERPSRAEVTLVWEGGDVSTRWLLGANRFGAGGFYALDDQGRVGTLKSPVLRWVRYAMTHLPSNKVLDWPIEHIATLRTRSPRGERVDGAQHQLDAPEYAYWAWEGRQGASRVLGRWARELLRPRLRGPLRPTKPDTAQEVLRATLTNPQGDEVEILWALDDEGGWVRASTLDGLWGPVRREDVSKLLERHSQVSKAADTETLYAPLPPGTPAHRGHAHP